MTFTSSKAGIRGQTNHFAFETNHLASIVFELNVDVWQMFESFLNCDLALVSDLLYFLKKAPKFVNPRRYGGKRGGGGCHPTQRFFILFF